MTVSQMFLEAHWRDVLYPLGLIASLAFMARFIIQWMISEVNGKSVVTPSFWRISLVANLLMVAHSIFQLQFIICLVQACNGVISWRNLNMMQDRSRRATFQTTLALLGFAMLATTGIFIAQGYFFFDGTVIWARSPTFFRNDPLPFQLPLAWHLLGSLGVILFASRFWVQWWQSETQQSSHLGAPFWWLSISGALLSVLYFLPMYDMVNMIGPALGLIPYMRNLVLMRRSQLREGSL